MLGNFSYKNATKLYFGEDALNYLNAVSEQLVAEHNGVLDLEKAQEFLNSEYDGEENG